MYNNNMYTLLYIISFTPPSLHCCDYQGVFLRVPWIVGACNVILVSSLKVQIPFFFFSLWTLFDFRVHQDQQGGGLGLGIDNNLLHIV